MPGISLIDRSMLVSFFLKRLTGAVVYTLILRGIPIIFHTYKKTYTGLFAHWTRQGLKLSILTFKGSQLVEVGHYRTTGEFFLVSANSSTILLYNTRLGLLWGKENALFLQAVRTSFHNETIPIREGPFADFTINYCTLQKSIISKVEEERKKKWWSQEEALCISLSLRALFSLSLCDANTGRAALAHSLVKEGHWNQVVWKNWGTQEKPAEAQGQSLYMTPAWNTLQKPVT